MTEIKWFKLDSHTFDTAEMKYLGKAEEGGALYQLCWIKLLCEAAKRGEGGRVYVYKNRAITLRELSILLDMDEYTVVSAIALLDALGLVKYDEVSGLVVRGFSEYVGEGDGMGERDSQIDEESDDDDEPSMTDEEIKKERNREAQRRWRERNKKRNAAAKESENEQILRNAEDIDSVIRRNNTVTNSNEKRNNTVIQRNTERNESNADSVISDPKNIFIEENRIEESRIEDKREEEIRKEENEKTLSHSLPNGACREEEKKSYYGVFKNVCLSQSELTQLRARFGDSLPSLIDELSTGMESSGKSYNSHFATLLRWGNNEYSAKRKAVISAGGGMPFAVGDRRGGDPTPYGRSDGSVAPCRSSGFGAAVADTEAQKRPPQNKSYGGLVRTITPEEAEEAFRLALERSQSEDEGVHGKLPS